MNNQVTYKNDQDIINKFQIILLRMSSKYLLINIHHFINISHDNLKTHYN